MIDFKKISNEYKTPLYLFDEETLINKINYLCKMHLKKEI